MNTKPVNHKLNLNKKQLLLYASLDNLIVYWEFLSETINISCINNDGIEHMLMAQKINTNNRLNSTSKSLDQKLTTHKNHGSHIY